jgi:branched-chain amino acid transport system ATP-binding protein
MSLGEDPAGLMARQLHVYHGRSHIVRGVSLHVPPGSIVALLGRNGAGKTTTLKAIAGILRPGGGAVLLDGQDVSGMPPYRRARGGLGYVPQGRLLFDSLSVQDNLRAVDRGRRGSIEPVLEMFPALRERVRQKAGTLSGGEQQMLAIARALVTRPRILLMDEPSTGLMPAVLESLRETMLRLRAEGIGVLLVEERVPFALEVASRAYLMESGQIVHEGPVDTLTEGDLLVRHLGVASSSATSRPRTPRIGREGQG